MAFVDGGDVAVMGGNSLNLKLEMDNDDDIEMETDDEEMRSVGKDDDNKSVVDETEEGELVDGKDDGLDEPVFNEHRPLSRPNIPLLESGRPLLKLLEENAFNTFEKKFENRSGGFVTGVDIFSAEEQEKLTKRAQRFGIDPSEAKTLTQELFKKLYKSMGVTPGDPNIRLDALHMRGTEEMNTQDVFSYFKDYAPASIEWLTSSSCNIMWLDDISAARALLGLSVKIKNIEKHAKESKRRKDFDNGSVEDATMDEDEESDKEVTDEEEDSDAVSVSKIDVPVPDGLWRKGVPHPRSKCIFLRFATRDDRRAPQLNKSSQDFAGYIGLISESKKRKFQEQLGQLKFYDTGDEVYMKMAPEHDSNPWSAIAHSWGAFDRNKNKIRPESPPKRSTPPPSPVFMNRYDRPTPLMRHEMWDMKKRRHDRDSGGGEGHSSEEDNGEDWVLRRKVPRMRMHADDEALMVEKRLGHHRSERHSGRRRSDLRRRLEDDRDMIVIKKEKSSSPKDSSEEEDDDNEEEPPSENFVSIHRGTGDAEEEEEVPDLRVAVVADRSPSPEDNKDDVWRLGQVKSVLRGARAHDSHNHEYDNDDDRRVRSSIRKHRSRSRERHRHSRRRKEKESSRRQHSRSSGNALLNVISPLEDEHHRHHRVRRTSLYEEEYDSDEVAVQPNARDLRAKISKKKKHDRDHDRDREHDSKHRHRSHRERDSHRYRDRDNVRDSDRYHCDDVSSKTSAKEKDSVFRPKSPLQIEIDNDEYYKLIESD